MEFKFILNEQQRELYRSLWKKFLSEEAIPLKKAIRIGRSHSIMLAQHVLRHILLEGVDHIDQKIIKAFKDQRKDYPYNSLKPSAQGLRDIVYAFRPEKGSAIASHSSFQYYKPVLETLTVEQIRQIHDAATNLADKYEKGLI